MFDMVWIFLAVGVALLLVLFLGIYLWKLSKKGWKHETDYYIIFIMGIVLLPLGITLEMPFFFILGIIYMALGLANKDKWKKQKMTKEQRKMLKISLIGGIIAFMAGVSLFLLIM